MRLFSQLTSWIKALRAFGRVSIDYIPAYEGMTILRFIDRVSDTRVFIDRHEVDLELQSRSPRSYVLSYSVAQSLHWPKRDVIMVTFGVFGERNVYLYFDFHQLREQAVRGRAERHIADCILNLVNSRGKKESQAL